MLFKLNVLVLGFERATGKVGRLLIQPVVILCRLKQFSLLFSQVVIRVHARVPEHAHVPLELLDLAQVVNEGFRHLLHQQRPIRHIKLNLGFNLVVSLFEFLHLAAGFQLGFLFLGKLVAGRVYHRWGAFHSLAQAGLLLFPFEVFVLGFLFAQPGFLNQLAAMFDHGVVLFGRRGLVLHLFG
jgi:hypothetical protein